ADLVADFGMEDLRPAAGKAAEAGLLELGEDVASRSARESCEPVPLNGGVRLQVEPRMSLVEDADDVQVPVVRKLVVETADDVHLGGAASLGLGAAGDDLGVRHDVALLALQVGPEGAEGAAVNADVGRIEML